MTKENVLISIITVCYNSEKTIEKTIESILNQNFQNFEYIIIDGKSTDATIGIIEFYKQKFIDKNISLTIVSEVDNGIYDAMNKGVKLAKGNLIGILNSDDWYESNILLNVYDIFVKTNSYFIHGNMNLYSVDREFIKTLEPKNNYTAIRKMPFFHPTAFVHKTIYNQLGYYSLKYKICSDYDFILRVIKNNFKITYLNIAITNFTKGGISTTQIKQSLQESDFIRVNNGYNKIVSKFFYYIERIICKLKYSQ